MEPSAVKDNSPQQHSLSDATFGRGHLSSILKWTAVLTACVLGGCKEKPPSPPPATDKTTNAVVSNEPRPEENKIVIVDPSTPKTVTVLKAQSPLKPMPLTDKCADVQLLPEDMRHSYEALTNAALIICELDPQVPEILKDQRGAIVNYLMPEQVSDYVGRLTTPENGKNVAASLDRGNAALVTLYTPGHGVYAHYIFIDVLLNADFPEIILALNHELWHIKNQAASPDMKTSRFGSDNAEEIKVIDDSIASLTRIIERLRSGEPVMDPEGDKEMADLLEKLIVKERNMRDKLAATK